MSTILSEHFFFNYKDGNGVSNFAFGVFFFRLVYFY